MQTTANNLNCEHTINSAINSAINSDSSCIKNKKPFWGCVLVVSGTSIGAGMLGLPLAVASFGILNSFILLICLWLVMYYSACVMLDICSYNNKSASIATLCSKYVNKTLSNFSAMVIFFMLNALLVAFSSGAFSIMNELSKNYFNFSLNEFYTMLIFMTVMGSLVCFSMKIMDNSNKFLFLLKIFIFLFTMLLIAANISFDKVSFFQEKSNLYAFTVAVPLFFTSFGFHGSIPSLVQYAQNDRQTLKKAFFIGSLIPLIIYFIWVLTSIGIVYTKDPAFMTKILNNQINLGEFIMHFSNLTGFYWMKSCVSVIALLGIFTSFLGVSIGVFDFYKEKIKLPNFKQKNVFIAILTFLLPLIIATTTKEIFVKMLCIAGVFLSILAIIIPSIIWLKLYKQTNFKKSFSKIFIYFLMLIGFCVIFCEAYNVYKNTSVSRVDA